MGVDLGKHPKSPIQLLEAAPTNLGPVLELSLPNFIGSLVVFLPKKRKVGRLVRLRNKQKEENIPLWKLIIVTAKTMKQKTVKCALAIKGIPELGLEMLPTTSDV